MFSRSRDSSLHSLVWLPLFSSRFCTFHLRSFWTAFVYRTSFTHFHGSLLLRITPHHHSVPLCTLGCTCTPHLPHSFSGFLLSFSWFLLRFMVHALFSFSLCSLVLFFPHIGGTLVFFPATTPFRLPTLSSSTRWMFSFSRRTPFSLVHVWIRSFYTGSFWFTLLPFRLHFLSRFTFYVHSLAFTSLPLFDLFLHCTLLFPLTSSLCTLPHFLVLSFGSLSSFSLTLSFGSQFISGSLSPLSLGSR